MNNSADTQLAPSEEKGRGLILVAIMSVLFLAALDQTIVGTALPRVVTDLGGSALYTWAVNSYLLSSTIVIPLYGKFGDVFGRKPMLITGIVLFLAGSALSGQSQSMTQLIAFRTIQGLGAGALFPLSLAIIGDLFTPRERGRYQGIFGAVFGLSFIIGPGIGGFLTDQVSWRWIFYVNIPVGIVALTIVTLALRTHRTIDARVRDLDFLGIAVFTAGLVPFLIGLSNKGNTNDAGVLNDWMSFPVLGLVAIGVVLIGLFLVVEKYAQHPIVPLDLFKDRTMSASFLAVSLVSFGLFSAIIFLPRWYQVVHGMSATKAGYMVWPMLVGLIGSSVAAGIAISKTGKYKVLISSAMLSLALGGALITTLNTDTPTWFLWIALAFLGLGVGPTMSGFTVVIQNVAKRDQMGVATSTMTFVRQIGGSIGLAIAGTMFNSQFIQNIPVQMAAHGIPGPVVTGFTAQQGASASNAFTGVGDLGDKLHASLPAPLQQYVGAIVSSIHDAFSLAAGSVFWIVVVAGALAFLVSLIIKEVPLRTQHFSVEDAEAAAGEALPEPAIAAPV